MLQQFRILHVLAIVSTVAAHARLIDPPSRSSMWRFGFETPVNYNDNELFCGGLGVQYYANQGRCGVCGDAYNLPQPRPNEAGGKYAKGIIVRNYKKGQVINITVDVTANHLGYFVFHICPHNNPKKIVSQNCLDKYPLPVSNESAYKYYVKPAYLGPVTVPVTLPKDVICTQCVLQWQYKGENNWGRCANGSEGLGCGPQETFRACADVAITDGESQAFTEATKSQKTTPYSRTQQDIKTTKQAKIFTNPFPSKVRTIPTANPSNVYYTKATNTSKETTVGDNVSEQQCKGVPHMISSIPGLDYWCRSNCAMGHCPKNLCQC